MTFLAIVLMFRSFAVWLTTGLGLAFQAVVWLGLAVASIFTSGGTIMLAYIAVGCLQVWAAIRTYEKRKHLRGWNGSGHASSDDQQAR